MDFNWGKKKNIQLSIKKERNLYFSPHRKDEPNKDQLFEIEKKNL